MARKVFMSVLGTGIYNPCIYKGKNAQSVATRFIQEASLKEIEADQWTADDRVYIMLTKSARELNWGKDITERVKPDKTKVPYSGLELSLANMNLPHSAIPIGIPDGKDEAEMWEIFNIIYSKLETDDELYLDLTHAFRYLPMLMLILGNYAKFLKNVTIKYMSYGNYEARIKDELDHSKDIAPIVDLLPIVVLQDWTAAASSFKESGRVEVLVDTIKSTNKRLPPDLFDLQKNLVAFQLQLETCCGKQICEGEAAGNVKRHIAKVLQNKSLPAPTEPILESIASELKPFNANTIMNIKSALQWCRRYGLVQQGYILCQEGIVTVICERLKDNNPYVGDKASRKYRDYWSSILGIGNDDFNDESKWEGQLKFNLELTRSIVALEWVQKLRKECYSKLIQKRNHVAHGGFTRELKEKQLKQDFESVIDYCINFIDWNLTPPEIKSNVVHPAIFINLSNHPSDKWTAEQLAAAQQYGTVTDLPFPAINPGAGKEEIKRLAEETFDRIKENVAGKTATVHLMGEMTFTYALVRRLKDVGVRCVASTTDREVVDNGDGTRTTKFRFVRFRDYE